MVNTALAASIIPFGIAAGTLGIIFITWAVRWPKLSLVFLVGSLIVGQSIRIPFPGQGGGFLVSDMAVLFFLISSIGMVGRARLRRQVYSLLWLISLFIVWSGLTLLWRWDDLDFLSILVAGFYWLRLAAYLLVIPALLVTISIVGWRWSARLLIIGVGILLLLGFAQLMFISDLGLLGGGWDPHQGRMVSTWLDPNFFGGFLAVTLPFVLSLAIGSSRWRSWLLGLVAVGSLGLILTQSRSTLVALIMAVVLISPLLWIGLRSNRKQLVLITLSISISLLVILGLFGVLFGHRLAGLITIDSSVSLRVEALEKVWYLAQDYWVKGYGYNAYQFAAKDAGLIENFTIHSRAGADNSWLTLWVTTGIIGVILFAAFWVKIINNLILRWLRRGDYLSVGALVSVCVLIIHSQFVNSFLYAHLLLTLGIVVSLTLSRNTEHV